MLILLCILGFHGQIIDFEDAFSQLYIPGGEPFFVEFPRNFNIAGVQCYVFLRLNKILYGQSKAACFWYENLLNGLSDHGLWKSR